MLGFDDWLVALDSALLTTSLPAAASMTTRSSLYQVHPPFSLNTVTGLRVKPAGKVAASCGGVYGQIEGGVPPAPVPPEPLAPPLTRPPPLPAVDVAPAPPTTPVPPLPVPVPVPALGAAPPVVAGCPP